MDLLVTVGREFQTNTAVHKGNIYILSLTALRQRFELAV